LVTFDVRKLTGLSRVYKTTQLNWTQLTWFSFWRTDQ